MNGDSRLSASSVVLGGLSTLEPVSASSMATRIGKAAAPTRWSVSRKLTTTPKA